MTASRLGAVKLFSSLTFQFYKDTGWYIIDDTYAEPLDWGFESGC